MPRHGRRWASSPSTGPSSKRRSGGLHEVPCVADRRGPDPGRRRPRGSVARARAAGADGRTAGRFIGSAAVYMMLYAQFLAVIQMLVYAGAIMVLFVFVIMILNRPEDEPVAPTGRIGQAIGGVAILYLVGRLAMILINVALPNKAIALASPAPIMLPGWGSAGGSEAVGWGTVKAVGNDLFGPGLFPFEAISILLLVAVVGAIAIARAQHPDDGTDAG